MRVIVFSFLIAVLVIVFCFYSVNYLEGTAIELIEVLKKAENEVDRENWQETRKTIHQFGKKWDEKMFMWNLLIEHSELDNMEISITHIKSYMETKSIIEIKGEIAALIKYIEHIPEKEKLTIENIF